MRKITTLLALSLAVIMILSGCSTKNTGKPEVNSEEPRINTEEPNAATKEPVLSTENPNEATEKPNTKPEESKAVLLYQGHASLRITTGEGKVIYIDPYAGEGYDLPADLILITHQHNDHNNPDKIESRNPGCEVITNLEAIIDGVHQIFNLGYVTVEAAEANNNLHDPKQDVGYILTLSDGVQIYISGDTSQTAQMETFADRGLDYAFLCGDGKYNMSVEEASKCAALIGARHSIPYHLEFGELYNDELSAQFEAPDSLIVKPGEEIILNQE